MKRRPSNGDRPGFAASAAIPGRICSNREVRRRTCAIEIAPADRQIRTLRPLAPVHWALRLPHMAAIGKDALCWA